MAKRNRKLRNELNELEQSERNLYLINSKNDNISNRMDGLSLREILPKTQIQSDTLLMHIMKIQSIIAWMCWNREDVYFSVSCVA